MSWQQGGSQATVRCWAGCTPAQNPLSRPRTGWDEQRGPGARDNGADAARGLTRFGLKMAGKARSRGDEAGNPQDGAGGHGSDPCCQPGVRLQGSEESTHAQRWMARPAAGAAGAGHLAKFRPGPDGAPGPLQVSPEKRRPGRPPGLGRRKGTSGRYYKEKWKTGGTATFAFSKLDRGC